VLTLPAAVGSLEVSDSARGALRGGVYGDREEIGVDNLLQIDASLTWPTTSLKLGYGPRLGVARLLDGTIPTQVTFMHDIDAAFTLRRGRLRFELSQDFNFGTQSFGQLYGLPASVSVASPDVPAANAADAAGAMPNTTIPPGTGNPILLGSGVQVWSSRSAASLGYLWSRRWESTIDVSYSRSGADDPKFESVEGQVQRVNYPRLQTADAETALMYDLTRTHRIGGVLEGERGWTNRDDYWLVSLSGAWSHRWTSHTNLDLRMGAAFEDTVKLDRSRAQTVVPVGQASFNHSIESHSLRARFLVNVAYQPSINVLSAVLQDRLTALASASLATRDDSITLALSGSQSFPTSDPEAVMFAGASLSYDHQFAKWIGVEVGGQFVDQVTESDVNTGTIWTIYAGVGAQLSPIRF
jgi:hypothetical protein